MCRANVVALASVLVVLSFLQPAYAKSRFPDYPARQASECAVKSEKEGLVVGIQPIEDLNEQKTYFDSELTPKGYIPVYVVLENGSSEYSFMLGKPSAFNMGVSAPNKTSQVAITDRCQVGDVKPGCVTEQHPKPMDTGKHLELAPQVKHPVSSPLMMHPGLGSPVKTPSAGGHAPHTRSAGSYGSSNVGGEVELGIMAIELTIDIISLKRAPPTISLNVWQYMQKNELRSNTLSPGTSVHGFVYIQVPRKSPGKKYRLQIPVTKSGTDETAFLSLDF
jgi:hypothetical protein